MSTELDLSRLDPRLHALRRTNPAVATGLAQALATRWRVDVVLVRIGFAMLALCGGVGVALYAWGSALTPGSDGKRPIEAILPRMRSWSHRTQLLFIALTTLAWCWAVAGLTPAPWPLGIGLLVVAVIQLRSSARRTPDHQWSATLASSDDELIAQWRARMQQAAGTAVTQHVMPLDAPAERTTTTPVPAQAPARASWLAALGIAVLSAAAAVGAHLMGLSLWHTAGVALATMGMLSLLFALLVRRRRLPRLAVAALALALIPTGWLAVHSASWVNRSAESTLTATVVADDQVVDFREQDFSGVSDIYLTAVASEVTLILPGRPIDVHIDEKLSEIEWLPTSSEIAELPVTLHLNAAFAEVSIQQEAA